MEKPLLPVSRIHAMYDQGMDTVDIYEWFDCKYNYDDIFNCIKEYTDDELNGPDYDPFRAIPGDTDCLEYLDRRRDEELDNESNT